MADIKVNPSKMILYLIEEPEIFLHPNHQTHFRNKLTELSEEPNNQIILTSHSPYFLNNVKNYSQIKRVYIKENTSVLKELTFCTNSACTFGLCVYKQERFLKIL